jgi:hypothetical protein
MKDFTTGKLPFVHLRPDFDPSKHEKVQQSGFGLDLSEKILPDASNYVEIV